MDRRLWKTAQYAVYLACFEMVVLMIERCDSRSTTNTAKRATPQKQSMCK
jgi:hypothetical protein